MPETLKRLVASLATTAIKSADPYLVVDAALRDAPLTPLDGGSYKVISVGKAANMMMKAVIDNLPKTQQFEAIIVTNYENALDGSTEKIAGVDYIAAGHPIPDDNGISAGIKVEKLLQSATANDHVICLISGGGSALLPTPAGKLTLAEKAEISHMMLSEGLDIIEMNSVRQHLSRLKGGGMLHAAAPAAVTAFILSDVIGDDLRVIASGPTMAPISTRQAVVEMLQSKQLFEKMPKTARDILQQNQNVEEYSDVKNLLVGSNRLSLDAMLSAAQHEDIILVSDALVGDVAEACKNIVNIVDPAAITRRKIFIWGGETTVQIAGDGLGGRNQELALRFALAAEGWDCDFAFGSIGTDGRDGPTDAAGGIVDNHTTAKLRKAGLDPLDVLARNDSYNGLKSAGDLLITGATGTNVADIQILVCQPRQNLSH